MQLPRARVHARPTEDDLENRLRPLPPLLSSRLHRSLEARVARLDTVDKEDGRLYTGTGLGRSIAHFSANMICEAAPERRARPQLEDCFSRPL